METTHLDPELEEKIFKYVAGELPQEEIELIWEELLDQPYYIEFLKTASSLKHIAEQYERKEKRSKQPKNNFRRLAFAALFIFLMGLSTFLVYQQQAEMTAPQALDQLPLDITRSAIEPDSDYHRVYIQSLSLAAEGYPLEAVLRLKELKSNLPPESLLRFQVLTSLGTIAYNDGAYHQASLFFLENLESELLPNSISEENYWYLAQAQIKLYNFDEAANYLDIVIKYDGAYYRMAKELRAQIPD